MPAWPKPVVVRYALLNLQHYKPSSNLNCHKMVDKARPFRHNLTVMR